MSELLKDKRVVITGGAGLLGTLFAENVAKNGGIPVIADINKGSIDNAVEKIKSSVPDANVESSLLDITSKKEISDFLTQFTRIDALVNNAYPRNKNYGRKFEDVEYCDFCENVGMHLGGYFLISQQFTEFFKNQGFGNIVFISSIYGYIAPNFDIYKDTQMTMPVEYAAIKSAVIHLSKYIASYYKGCNIKSNVICPGGIFDNQDEAFIKKYNEQCMSKGMLDPTDIAGTLIYLLSDLSSFVNGQTIVVDDGFTL